MTRSAVLAAAGRPVPHENFHVTLVFLGTVPEADLERVEAIAAAVAQQIPRAPVQLTLEAIEYWKKAKVLCVTGQLADTRGSLLADVLKSRLAAAGFTPDLKPFRPHVTLARKVSHPYRVHSNDFPCLTWTFTEFALVESRTDASGSIYTVRRLYSVSNLQALCTEVLKTPEKKHK